MPRNQRKPKGMPDFVAQGIRILGRVSGRPSVLNYCPKAGGILTHESTAEKTVAQLAALDPRVATLKAQPLTVDVISGEIYHTRAELLEGRARRKNGER